MKNNIPWPYKLTKDTPQAYVSEVLEKVGNLGGGTGFLGGKVKTSEIIFLCPIYWPKTPCMHVGELKKGESDIFFFFKVA